VSRPEGTLEYKKDAEEKILKLIEIYPQTTNAIKEKAKENYWAKVHFHTVGRMLENLRKKGLIRCMQNPDNNIKLWSK
jgi:hypothetical protein